MKVLEEQRARDLHKRVERSIENALSVYEGVALTPQIESEIRRRVEMILKNFESEISRPIATLREIFESEGEICVSVEPCIDEDGWGEDAPQAIITARYLERCSKVQMHKGYQWSARLNEIAAEEIRFLMNLIDPEVYKREREKLSASYEVEKNRATLEPLKMNHG